MYAISLGSIIVQSIVKMKFMFLFLHEVTPGHPDRDLLSTKERGQFFSESTTSVFSSK